MKFKTIIIILLSIFILILLSIVSIVIFFKDIYVTYQDNLTLNLNEEYKPNNIKVLYCQKLLKLNCQDITDKIELKNEVSTTTLGSVIANYEVNHSNISKKFALNINIIDTTFPVISLVNNNTLTCPNQAYLEEGFSATDDYDKDITDKVKVINHNNLVLYSVSDSSGNTSNVNRKINYGDTTIPEIKLNGSAYTSILINNKYVESGATAYDNCDGDISNKIIVDSNVNTSKTGSYKVTYTVTDSTNNTTTVTRSVNVYQKQTVTTINPGDKTVYLTFDDGPSIYTPRLLDILKKYNVKATFFVTTRGYNDYILRAHNEGHTIALHTSSHVYNQVYASEEAYFNDLNKVKNHVYNITGVSSNILRFPGGSANTVSRFNPGIMTRLTNEVINRGYNYFDWNVSSGDTSTTNINQIRDNVINGIKKHNYSIVLQHDIKPNSVEATSQIIEFGLANGYTFLPLSFNSPSAKLKVNN